MKNVTELSDRHKALLRRAFNNDRIRPRPNLKKVESSQLNSPHTGLDADLGTDPPKKVRLLSFREWLERENRNKSSPSRSS